MTIKKTSLQKKISEDIYSYLSQSTSKECDFNQLKNLKFLSKEQVKEIMVEEHNRFISLLLSNFSIDNETALIIAENLNFEIGNTKDMSDFLFLIEGKGLTNSQRERLTECMRKIKSFRCDKIKEESRYFNIYEDLIQFFPPSERNIGELAYELSFIEYGKIGEGLHKIFKEDKEVLVKNEYMEFLKIKVKDDYKKEYQSFLNKVLALPVDSPLLEDFYFKVFNLFIKNKNDKEDLSFFLFLLTKKMIKSDESYNYYINKLNKDLLKMALIEYFENSNKDFSSEKLNVFYILVKLVAGEKFSEEKVKNELKDIKLFGDYDIEKYYFNHSEIFNTLFNLPKKEIMMILNVMAKNETEKFALIFKNYFDMKLRSNFYIEKNNKLSIFDFIKNGFNENIRVFFYFKEYYYPVIIQYSSDHNLIFPLDNLKTFNMFVFNEEIHEYIVDVFKKYEKETNEKFDVKNKKCYEVIENIAKKIAEYDYSLEAEEVNEEIEEYVFKSIRQFSEVIKIGGYRFSGIVNCIFHLNVPVKELLNKSEASKMEQDLFLMTLYIAHVMSGFMSVNQILDDQTFDLNLNSDEIVSAILNAQQWNDMAPSIAVNPKWRINIKLREFLEMAGKLQYLGKFKNKQYIEIILSGLSNKKTTEFDETDFEKFIEKYKQFDSPVYREIFNEYVKSM